MGKYFSYHPFVEEDSRGRGQKSIALMTGLPWSKMTDPECKPFPFKNSELFEGIEERRCFKP